MGVALSDPNAGRPGSARRFRPFGGELHLQLADDPVHD